MNYILLLITTLTLAAQAIITKQYGKKGTNDPIAFGALSAFL